MPIATIEALSERKLEAMATESVEGVEDILSAWDVTPVGSPPPQLKTTDFIVNSSSAESKVLEAGAQLGFVALVEIDEPELDESERRVNIEKLVAKLQLENDVQALKITQERLEQAKKVYEKRHKDLMEKIEQQIAQQIADKQGETLGRVFRWIGVATAIAMATAMSIIDGGTSLMLVLAAVVTTVLAVLEESGGMAAMQKAITKSLEEDQGMAKQEAAAAASYIMMGAQLAIEIALMVASFGAANNVGNTASKLAQNATKAAKAASLENSTSAMAKHTVKLMNAMTTFNLISQISNTVMGVVQAVLNYKNAKRMFQADMLQAEIMDEQAVLQAWEAYLDEHIDDLKRMMQVVQKQFSAFEDIVASRLNTATTIVDVTGGMI